jgi:PAS domain S-box-containing protein
MTGDEKYRSIFEHAAVSLWEEDISRLRSRLSRLKAEGVTDIRAHITAHPGFVQEAVSLIEVTDVNDASLRLFQADSRAQLLGPLNTVLDAVSRAAVADTIIAVDEGRSDVEAESTAVTLRGKKLSLIAKTHIPPAGAPYSCMIISLIDITARTEAEERARRSDHILYSIIGSSPEAICVKDRSLRMVVCNSAHSRSVGKEPTETYGKTDIENGWSAELVRGNPEKGIQGWEKDDLAALSGRIVQSSRVPSNVDNEIHYFDVLKMPLRNPDGEIFGIVGVGRDVTGSVKAELDLAWERSLLSMLMSYLPDHIYFKDLASRFTRTSASHARLLGMTDPSEAVGKTDADFYGADHALKAFADEQNVIRTGTPLVNIEERETYPDRPDTWAITTKMPLRNAAGEIIGTFGISHDITGRKKLEEKNRQLATLVEFVDDAIVGLDLNRKMTVWNRGAERLYGYTAEEMIGAPTSSLIPPELEEEARLMRQRVSRGEQIDQYETTRLRKDGSRITVALTLSAIRDPEGRLVGMASVARDVTAQKALQARLNRAHRLEGLATLARGVAHQFNNINTVVRGYIDLLKGEKRLSARQRSYVQAAHVGVQKAVDITDRLLALTEPAEGASHAVRLDLLARELLPLHQDRISDENVRLVLNLAETGPAEGDEKRMRFVLSALVGNALDSLLDRPVRIVSIRTGNARDAAYFEIEDSGCGIPEEDLPRIFSPFFTAKGEWAPTGSPQSRLKGVGLSLAISSTTVSEYGGKIDVQSTKGAGSTFRVEMPLAAQGV